jgi:hypothetical protein
VKTKVIRTMAESLKISSVTTSSAEEQSPIPHDFLPKPPFRFIVCGASFSGKSNMIKYMLTNDNFGYRQYFGEIIIVFSKTLGMDEIWTSLKLPKSHYYKEWDDDIVKEIMEYSRKQKRGVLLLLDDLISDTGAFNRRNGNLLTSIQLYTGAVKNNRWFRMIVHNLRVHTAAEVSMRIRVEKKKTSKDEH